MRTERDARPPRLRRHEAAARFGRALACLLLAAGLPLHSIQEDPVPPQPVIDTGGDAAEEDAARIREHLRADRWPEALALAREAHAARPDDASMGALLAEALFRAGLLPECASFLEYLTALDAPPPAALLTLARLRAAEGRGAEVEDLLSRALEAAPGDRDVLYWAGDLAGERSRAIELLERYLAVSEGDDPDRIEAAQGAVRFMRQLGDRRVWVARASPPRVELPLTQLWDGGGRTVGYVVEARLGGRKKPVRLLLDTGSHALFLVERVANKRGFEPLADKTLFGAGGKGRHATRRGVIPSLELGGLRFEQALATTTRDEFDPTGRFHGLLGISIFGGYRVTLDLVEKKLVLEAPKGDAGDAGDAGDDVVEGAPYWWISGQMLAQAAAGDAEGLFVLDSGATASVVADRFLERARADADGAEVSVRAFGGSVSGARLIRGLGLSFQGLHSQDGVLAYDMDLQSRLGGVEVSGLVGLDLLAKQRIVIDTRRQRIAVEPGPGKSRR